MADGKRVRQVLFNLLSNAVGFSRRARPITRHGAQRRGEEVRLRGARIEGRGIPPEVIDARLRPVREPYARDRAIAASGLGLSIVRSFVELHGGRVELDSAPGRGTTVTCIFPADGARAAAGRGMSAVAMSRRLTR